MNTFGEGSRLITARDLARRDGCASVAQWVQRLAERSIRRSRFTINWDGMHVGGSPVLAFVDFGRWMARCECGQHNYADPDEPVMFCARCGNGNSGLARQVLFPTNRQEIEELLLLRPIVPHPLARNEIEGARLAKPLIALLPRCWYPNQRAEDLLAMNIAYGGR